MLREQRCWMPPMFMTVQTQEQDANHRVSSREMRASITSMMTRKNCNWLAVLVAPLVLLLVTVSCAHAASTTDATPSTCDFSTDRLTSSPFDNRVATELKQNLEPYRLTTKQLPQPPIIYAVTVRARTAVINVAKQNPTLPNGAVTTMDQRNDFRYTQVWQRVYDTIYHTRGACVRTMLMIRGDGVAMQRCWGSRGFTCGR